MTQEPIFFWRPNEPNGYLGNWYPSPFTVDGKKFVNSEHYFMWQKVMTFQPSLERTIMRMTDPKQMKELCSKIQNYDDVKWSSLRVNIMKKGVMEKFKQNSKLKNYLLSTGNAMLVEASPYDKIWGIGMNADNALKAYHKNIPFNGNLLGKVLMDVRNELK